MSTLITSQKDQTETILYSPIENKFNEQGRDVVWFKPEHANDTGADVKASDINSGIFAFAADDPDFVDEHGHVLLTNVFNHNAKDNRPLTPAERQEHLQKGLTKKWPALKRANHHQVTHILHASGSTVKVNELRQALQHNDVKIKLIGSALGYTVEDSKETQDNGAEITQDKILISIENEMATLKPSEIEEVQASLDVKNFETTIGISDDRSVLLDPTLRQSSVWDDIRDSEVSEVKEAFQDYHDFPGKRMKEVMKACGGAINFADRLQAAHAELNAKGIETNRDVSFGVWVFAKPLEKDVTALPNAGAYFYQQMNGAEFIPVTDEDRLAASKGKTFDVDHFVVAAQHIGLVDKNGLPYTLANLRSDKTNFYAEDHPIAQIMHKITDLLQVPMLDDPQNWDPARIANPKATAAGGHKAHISKTKKLKKGPEQGRKSTLYHLTPEKKINTIKNIERAYLKSDALIVPAQDYSHMRKIDALSLKLTRRLIVDGHLALFHAGSYVASGCPLVIAQDALNEHKHHASFYNSGASATHLMDVVKTYDGTAASLARTLKSAIWDPEAYKPHEKRKKLKYDFMTEDELCNTIGISDISELGTTVAVLGGATTELPSAMKQTEDMAYEAAKQGITLLHGGGSRGVMGAIMKGAIRAYNEGYRDFKQIAIRTPIVSAAEGSMAQFLEKNDLDVTKGDINSDYYSFMDNHIHVIEKPAFGVRQDAILRFAQGAIVMPGGHGTAYEDDHINKHNVEVKRRGYGVFKGDDVANTRLIDKHIINVDGYFDDYIETLTPEEQSLIGQTVGINATEALMQIKENLSQQKHLKGRRILLPRVGHLPSL
ncbi:MAG: hypothetical protein CL570_06670 [Alphaproteobacteria bacterium]|nr:hypothetical protein [Alphaproteobacteria bacterium]|tara:strand:+ start:55012 stop:57507 length:2496 start_codon:yes stop_codon:yes gene_type:complete